MNTATATRNSINFAADSSTGTKTSATRLGIALLRIALGAMFLAHGLLKALVFTLPGTAGFFESVGFPGFLAYVVIPAEVLAGIALVVGFRTRLVAAATIPLLIGAASVHLGNGWLFSSANGGWEYPVYLIVAALAQSLLGGGAFAFDDLRTRSV
ncbi:MAG: DoxX family protein [Propionivibrio sp.]